MVEYLSSADWPTDMLYRDVTDSESESDGIRHFFLNPKSDGYLKSDHNGFTDLEMVVSVEFIYCLYNFFRK